MQIQSLSLPLSEKAVVKGKPRQTGNYNTEELL